MIKEKEKVLNTIGEEDLHKLSKEEAESFLEQTLTEDSFIMVNRKLALLHSLEEAAFIAHLILKRKQLKYSKKLSSNDEPFYTEQKEVEDSIALSPYQQNRVWNSLEKKGLIEVKRKGIPRRNYYRVNDFYILRNLVYVAKETKSMETKKLSHIINNKDLKGGLKKKIISKDIIQKENLSSISFNSEEEKPSVKKTKNRASNKTLLPEGFNLNKKMRVFALEKRPELDIELEFESFLNHHESKGSKFSSWEAAWRNWILMGLKFEKVNNGGFKQKQQPSQTQSSSSLYPDQSKEEQEIVLEQFNYWCREELDNSQKEYELDKLTASERAKLNQAIYLAKEVLKPGNIEKDSGEYGGSWEWKDPDKMITDRNGKKYFDDEQEKVWIENKEKEYGAHKQDRFGYSIENVAQYLSRALNFLVTDQLELNSFPDKKIFLGHLCNRWVWEKVLLNYVKVAWGVNDFKINEVFFNNYFPKKEN